MNGNVIRTITIRGTSEGLDKVEADLKKVAAATENVAVVSEQSAKRVLSLEDAWKRQTLKLDEAARAQANIARETKLADAALKEGIATQAQHAQRLEQINQRYNTVSTATKGFAQQTGLARHELINLGRQAQDVGVSLVSGQSPLMVLAQQGSQIADVFISSGKSVGSFFSQAIGWAGRFAMSTAGIVTGIAAVGGAAIYAAYQFTQASTTIEEALKEQNRLLKEGKALIDARTSAEDRSQLQSKAQTQFEMLRNILDVQIKLNKAMEDAANTAGRRSTTPTGGGMPEMGIAPSGVAPLKDPGLDKMAAAVDALNAAIASGQPGLKQFNAELAAIGLAHPELARSVEEMLKLGEAGRELENAAQRAKAISDALKGIATDAQMAAVGLKSIAQFTFNNLKAVETEAATERMAKMAIAISKEWGDVGISTALALNQLQNQLTAAQAITGQQQIQAQHLTTINTLLVQGKTLTEATAMADMQRAIALAQVNAEADRTLKSLQQQGELLRASSDYERERIQAAHEYNKLIDQGVDALKAGAIAAQMTSNARSASDAREMAAAEQQAARAAEQHASALRQAREAAWSIADAANRAYNSWYDAAQEMAKFTPFAITAAGTFAPAQFKSNQGGNSQFNPQGYTSDTPSMAVIFEQIYGKGGFDPTTGAPSSQGLEFEFNRQLARAGGDIGSVVNTMLGKGVMSAGQMGAPPQIDTNKLGLLTRGIDLLSPEQQIGSIQNLVGQLEGAPRSLQSSELIKQLNDKLEQLTKATEDNTNATSAMTDVLSPFYSQDPRRTHLGFRSFAGGGIMTEYGALPLRQYAGGGIATSPQVAVFGEGSTPEAYVPAPNGQIPVVIKQPANSNQRPVNVTINVMGNADNSTVAALRQTSFQKAQQLRRVTG